MLDRALRALAARQHGVISRAQARALGATTAALAHRIARGEWEPMTPMVLRLRGAPVTDRQLAMAAVLDAGRDAVLSHHSAGALWRLPGFDLRALHVTRPRRGGSRGGRLSWVHQTGSLPPHHVTAQDGIPVTTPARTIFDLAGFVHPKRVKRALETAWSERLVDGIRLARVLDEMGTRGRAGTAVTRELLAERGPDYVPPASGLEGRFADILARDGQPPMQRQVDLGGTSWLGRVDFYDPEAKVVVQIDSERYHSALIDKEADECQTAALEAAGFRVLRFSDFEVWYRAHEVVAQVRHARRRAACPEPERATPAGA